MKTHALHKLLVFFIMSLFLLAGCSSLEKARSLHNDGKDKEALKMAAEYLEEDDPLVRLEAVKLIGDIGGDEAGRLLMPMMEDEDIDVKNAAIRNIGEIEYEPASEKLVEMSVSTKGDTFEEVADAIRKIGTPAISVLVKRYNRTADPSRKDDYKRAMLQVGPSVAAEITKTLAGKSYFENRGNFELLVAFKNPMVAKWMLEDIDNEEVADMIVEGLVNLGNKAVNPIMNELRPLLEKDERITVKERLIRALGDIKDRRAIPLLEEFTKDDSERVRNAAEFALKKIRGF